MLRLEAALRRECGDFGRAVFSESADHVRSLARAAVEEQVDVFAVCGGDGTAHYGLQPLVHSETALGILPVGSGNDLAMALGIPGELESAVRILARGPTRRIDVARTRSAFYACIAGVGFDSEVNRRANQRNRWIRGRILYPWAIMRTLASFRPRVLRIRCDEQTFEGPVMFAVMANAASYGRGIRIAPMARLDDGFLDVCIIQAISKFELLRVYPKTYRGAHVNHPCFMHLRGHRVNLESEQPLDLYGDGEFMEQTPSQIEVVPLGLRVVTPEGPNPAFSSEAPCSE